MQTNPIYSKHFCFAVLVLITVLPRSNVPKRQQQQQPAADVATGATG